MKKIQAGKSSIAILIASFLLVSLLAVKSSTSVMATGQDECNEVFKYENQVNDGRVLIDTFNTGASGNPDSITVTAKSGYKIIAVKIELDDNNTFGWDVELGEGNLDSYNPSGTDIEDFEVFVKKVCATSSPTQSPTASPSPSSSATSTPTTQPTIDPCDGPCPTETSQPTEEPTTTPEPTVNPDVCLNLDGIQTSVPEGLHLGADNTSCVAFSQAGVDDPTGPAQPQTQGQVLGASTMAGTGSFLENLYLAIMTIGATLSFKGLKNFKKAFKKA